jgi:ubiquinone/menaquinone biosynthesis C-methylase UbiE
MKSTASNLPATETGLNDVANFWSASPCGSATSNATDRTAYFEEIEAARYHNEPHIPKVAHFGDFAGKKVLEVGCGVGTDGRQFVRNGAVYTGINLDVGSTQLAKEGFEVFGLPATVLQMNGERLSFDNATFDHVYSFGVIHHSPDTVQMLREMYRVLKPGGTITVMVYHRNSVNYWFEIMFLRKVLRYALMPKAAPRAISSILHLDRQKLERHRQILLESRMTPERWLSINTDGPDCPLAKVYSAKEAMAMARDAGFTGIETTVRFFDVRHYGRFGTLFPRWLVRWLGNHAGWHLMLYARKRVDAA